MSTKKPSPFSLESFETSASDEIQIFTDSRDRIPAPGPVSGNPFTSQADAVKSSSPVKRGKRAARTQETGDGSSSERIPVTAARRRRKVPNDDDSSPNPEEGITMIFRGKKVFTRFSDLEEEDEDEDDLGLFATRPDLLAANPDILKRAKPLTRNSIKPRILFPGATEGSRPLEEEDATDEEDVEVAEAPVSEVQVAKTQVPPTKVQSSMVTPAVTPESPEIPQAPGATRLLRSSARFATQGEETPTGTNSADTKRKRISPFDQWLRKKQAIEELSSPAPPAKREADSSDDGPVTPHSAKKTRSTRGGASTASSS
ncbi:hypothetical protein PENSUB_7728 [Penicillium subrubescens]|uniref:Uncharacterized protein n=2 Tax=Penicillium subrubescens TaxID=1316194 RepID=A0A1Q5TKN9_9EURO|nr:hypothetical protein PENSUB_7728 [Penicillium subrubescens]